MACGSPHLTIRHFNQRRPVETSSAHAKSCRTLDDARLQEGARGAGSFHLFGVQNPLRIGFGKGFNVRFPATIRLPLMALGVREILATLAVAGEAWWQPLPPGVSAAAATNAARQRTPMRSVIPLEGMTDDCLDEVSMVNSNTRDASPADFWLQVAHPRFNAAPTFSRTPSC